MKKASIFIWIILINFVYVADLVAAIEHGSPKAVPLDGGLLTILGAAGITYYIARKKKKAKM